MSEFMYLFVGRFQPFHKLHLDLMRNLVRVISAEIIIGIAVKKLSFDNPFTFMERQVMIQKTLVAHSIDVGLIRFTPVFVPRALDWEINNSLLPSNRIWCIGSKDMERIENYRALGERVLEIDTDLKKVSATTIRKKIVNGEPWEEFVPDTIAEYIYQIDGHKRIVQLYQNAIFCNEPVAGLPSQKRSDN